MKKVLIALAVVLALVTFNTATAQARCGRGTGTQKAAQYTVCPYDSCAVAGIHLHNNTAYCSHYIGDGHDYHEVCDYTNCTQTCYHEHDGDYFFGCNTNNASGNYGAGGCHR